MLSRIRAILAAFALALTFFVVASGGARAESPSGAVYVTTLPAGADIWLDGTYVGRSPVLIDALTPGRHAMTITKGGWVTAQVDVPISSDTVAMSSTRLEAGPRALAGSAAGTIVLRDVPAGAGLALDGAPFAPPSGRSVTLPAGKHRITATTAHAKYTRDFTVLPDMATEVVLRAPAADARSAVVAPAEDYLPTDNFSLEGTKIVVRYAGHVVVAHLGEPLERVDGANVSYDAAPQTIGGKLYMPLTLLEKLTDDTSNDH